MTRVTWHMAVVAETQSHSTTDARRTKTPPILALGTCHCPIPAGPARADCRRPPHVLLPLFHTSHPTLFPSGGWPGVASVSPAASLTKGAGDSLRFDSLAFGRSPGCPAIANWMDLTGSRRGPLGGQAHPQLVQPGLLISSYIKTPLARHRHTLYLSLAGTCGKILVCSPTDPRLYRCYSNTSGYVRGLTSRNDAGRTMNMRSGSW